MSALSESTARARDAEARRRAQSQFDRPLVLEAGAGTGKTSTLVARLLQWTLGPGWTRAQHELESTSSDGGNDRNAVARHVLQRVLAITFTEAAATQMGSRVALALIGLSRDREERNSDEERALAGFQSELLQIEASEVRNRATALLGNLDHLAAQTFHSWCRGLLAQYPIEAGVHPAFRIDADGLMTERIVDEVLESQLSSLYADDPDAPAVQLLTQHIGAGALREQLVHLAASGVPAAELERNRFTRNSLQPLLRALRDAASTLQARLEVALGWAGVTKVVIGLAAIAGTVREWCDEHTETEGASAFEAALDELTELVPKTRLSQLGNWASSRFNSNWEEEHLPSLGDDLSLAAGRLHGLLTDILHQKPVRFALLSEAMAPAVDEIQSVRQSRGILSFDDLLDRAAELLERHPAICAAQRSRCDQLMVDEFQDTDRRQCELVRRVALTGAPDSRPGLFIVGDPKQSLYGWREADLAAYAEFLKEIENEGGDILSLTVNFRSVPVILDEVERVVSPVMTAEEGLQPQFEPLHACSDLQNSPGFTDRLRRPIEYWVTWEQSSEVTGDGSISRTAAGAAADVEFAALTEDLLELRESGLAWDAVGILMRTRSRLTDLLDHLRRAGIPYQVEGERTYFLRREIIEAAALLRTVAQPHDRLALVTTLRTAWIGVPDLALKPLFERRFDELLAEVSGPEDPQLAKLFELIRAVAEELPDDLPGLKSIAGWEANLLAAVEAIARLRQTLETEPADRFVDQLRRLLLIDATESARLLGAFRTANLDRFFHQLEQALESESNLPGLLRFLRRAIEDSRQAPAAPITQRSGAAVQIMTIHGAKGLDFEHVYLLQAAAQERSRRVEDFAFRRPAEQDAPWGLTLLAAPGPEWPLVAAGERRREAAERVRLLYVAMTRARSRLVISGNWPSHPQPRPPEVARHLQDLLQNRAELPEDLESLHSKTDHTGRTEAGGVLWHFPAPSGSDRSREASAAAAWIPKDDQLERMFTEQIATQAAAREHQAHPLLLRATEFRIEPERVDEDSEAVVTVSAPVDEDGDAGESRRLARRIGTLIHAGLERWRLEHDPEEELNRLRTWVNTQLDRALPPEALESARERLDHLLGAFAEGAMARRWAEILPCIEAREMPLLIPQTTGEVRGALTGAIDLIYRDPESSRFTLIDFKTDRLNGADDIDDHVRRYSGQARVYRSAIQTALSLDSSPQFEFWFLDARAIVSLADDAGKGETES